MTPDFALSLSFDGIGLLTRFEGGWAILNEISLEDDDFEERLLDMQSQALALGGELFTTKLIIPNEQIRYVELPFPEGHQTPQQLIEEDLQENTPYAIDEIVYDWEATDYGTIRAAAVARETLEEAEGFALTHNFAPVYFVAVAPQGRFSRPPWFGPTQAVENFVEPSRRPKEDPFPIQRLPQQWITLVPVSEELPQEEAFHQDFSADPDFATTDLNEEDGSESASEQPRVEEPETEPNQTQVVLDQGDLDQHADETTAEPPVIVTDNESDPTDVAQADSGIIILPEASAEKLGEEIPDYGDAPVDEAISDTAHDPENQDDASKVAPEGQTQAKEPEQRLNLDPNTPVLFLDEGETSQPAEGAPGISFTSIRAIPSQTASHKSAPDPSKETFIDDTAPEPKTAAVKEQPAQAPARRVSRRKRRAASGNNGRLAIILTGALAAGLAVAALIIQEKDDGQDRAKMATAPQPDALLELDTRAESIALQTALATNGTQSGIIAPIADKAPVFFPREALPERAAPLDAPMSRAPALDSPKPVEFGEFSLTENNTDSALWVDTSRPLPYTQTEEITLAALQTVPLDQNLPVLAVPEPASPGAELLENAMQGPVRDIIAPPPAQVADTPQTPSPQTPTESAQPLASIEASPPSITRPTSGATANQVELASLQPNAAPLIESAQDGNSAAETSVIATPRRPKLRPEGLVAPAVSSQSETGTAAISQEAAIPPESVAVAPRQLPAQPLPKIRPKNLPKLASTRPISTPSLRSARSASTTPSVTIRRSTGGVARAATQEDVINLRKINLIGVSGTSSNRSALIRLANGNYQKVRVGDRVDGGRVAAIGARELRYVKSGRNIVLKLPQG